MGQRVVAVLISVVLAVAAGLFTMPAVLTAIAPGATSTVQPVAKVSYTPVTTRQVLAGEVTPSPAQAERWWSSLDADARRDAVSAAPAIIGNLDGVPYDVRDAVNRDRLAAAQREAAAAVESASPRARVSRPHNQQQMLASIDESLAGGGRQLVTLDTAYPGRAAIAVGNLAVADYVGFLVPGMYFSVRSQMVDWTDIAVRLAENQSGWLATGQHAEQSVAVVAWMGYETPDVTTFLSTAPAREGAAALAASVSGLDATRRDDEPYVTVIGHSYGSTAALMALQQGAMRVDALALVGSPGSPAASSEALGVEEVYVGRASWDPVAGSAFYGFDPGAVDFGARLFGVDGGLDLLTGDTLQPSLGHNAYFAEGSESMRNLALIGLDQGEAVGEVAPLGSTMQASE